MELLECGEYSRNDIERIFHTDRIDSIKRSLDRAGYKYKVTGRGQKAIFTIIEQPDPFVVFAKEELDHKGQARFDAMKVYYRFLLFDSDFRYYPATYQVQLMKQCNISVSDQSLRNWKRRLIDKGLIVVDESDCRYYLCLKGEQPLEITHEEFIETWSEYHKGIKEGAEPGEAIKNMINKCGGKPVRDYGFYESALERERIDKLHSLLDN